MTASTWTVERHGGRAGALHHLPLPDELTRRVWPFALSGPAVALGSTQPESMLDAAAAAADGLEVVRRRSGGGAVLLVPGDVTWVDVLVPATDPLWEPDIGRSFGWLGDTWAGALGRLGLEGADVHRGPIVHRRWSDLVCFAGLGPGEVTLGGAKVVGLSQRRTRAGARFQCAVLHRWDPARLLRVCALGDLERQEALVHVTPAAVGLGPVDPADLMAAFLAELTLRTV